MKHSALKAAAALAMTTALASPALAAPKISDDIVRIGVLTDMAGQFSHEAGEGSVTAVKMAVEDFGGKVLGKKIDVISADHQNKADVGAAVARRWFDVEQVDMVANMINSGVALAITHVAEQKKRVAIVNGSGSSKLTNEGCTPYSIHYAYDTYALATGTAKAMLHKGLTKWYFLTADYAFGHALEGDTRAILDANDGKTVGAVRYPMGVNDHSSFIFQAKNSDAEVVAMAGSGTGFVNAVKSAHEFGLTSSKTVVGLLVWLTDVKALGQETAQGLTLTNAFYWNRTPEARAWSERFFERMGRMPHMGDAGDYSSTLHYLKAIEAAGTDDADAVMAKMRELPINDMFATNGKIRIDGRMVHDMYVYRVKKPTKGQHPWDFYELIETIPGDEAFRPLSESQCKLVTKS